jgi:hypothetical protein
MRRRIKGLEGQAERMQDELLAEIERVRKSYRAELVPYRPPEQSVVRVRRSKAR